MGFTCADVDERLDGFIDSQLPPQELLDVARHGASCPACETRIQRATVLSHLVGTTITADAAGLDLSAVWAGVEARLDPIDHDRRTQRWRETLLGRRALPLWGAGMALAAAVPLWLRTTATAPLAGGAVPGAVPVVRVATGPTGGAPDGRVSGVLRGRPLIQPVVVDRLKSGNAVQVKREKDGTTLIWVRHPTSGQP